MPPKPAMMAAWLEKAKEGEPGTVIHSPAIYYMRLNVQVQCFSSKSDIISTDWSVFLTLFSTVFLVSFLHPRTRAYARHVLAFVVSRFVAGNYVDNH